MTPSNLSSIELSKSGGDGINTINAMTVDVEEWFQAQALETRVPRGAWPAIPSRVVATTHLLLDLFAETEVKATFFILGWVAQREPALLRRMVQEGHEIASHGMTHTRVDRQSPAEFEIDAGEARRILEDVSGVAVTGYRAASFSFSEKTPWAFEKLAECGYRYSSSVFPGRHDIYGMPGASRTPYKPIPGDEFLEIPMTVVDRLGRPMMAAGGGFFRLFPYAWSQANLRQVNVKEGRAAVFYMHPWEVDTDPPQVVGLSPLSNFRTRVGLSRTVPRLRRLLTDFRWGRMDHVFPTDPTADRR